MFIEKDVINFLEQSNHIEGVYDQDSLDQAIAAWEYLTKEPELTLQNILKTHKILMLNQPLQPDQKGYFRKVNVGIRRGSSWIKHFPAPETIKTSMGDWLYISEKVYGDKVHTPEFTQEWIKQSHIRFEEIHPFVDGNGRMGRIIMNWQRVRAGLPVLIIQESEKEEYYQWFSK